MEIPINIFVNLVTYNIDGYCMLVMQYYRSSELYVQVVDVSSLLRNLNYSKLTLNTLNTLNIKTLNIQNYAGTLITSICNNSNFYNFVRDANLLACSTTNYMRVHIDT